MNMQATGQTIAAPRPALSPTEKYRMSTATARTVSAPRWMLWTGRLLSFLVVAQLLSSAWFRATYHTYAVAEIVTGYGYPESAIVPIVIAECALVVLYLVPQTAVLAAIVMTGCALTRNREHTSRLLRIGVDQSLPTRHGLKVKARWASQWTSLIAPQLGAVYRFSG